MADLGSSVSIDRQSQLAEGLSSKERIHQAETESQAYDFILSEYVSGKNDEEIQASIHDNLNSSDFDDADRKAYEDQRLFIQSALLKNKNGIDKLLGMEQFSQMKDGKEMIGARFKEEWRGELSRKDIDIDKEKIEIEESAPGLYRINVSKAVIESARKKGTVGYHFRTSFGTDIQISYFVVSTGESSETRDITAKHELHHVVWNLDNDFAANKSKGEAQAYLKFQDEIIAYLLSGVNCDETQIENLVYEHANDSTYMMHQQIMGEFMRVINQLDKDARILIPTIRKASSFDELISSSKAFVVELYKTEGKSEPEFPVALAVQTLRNKLRS